MKPSRMFRYAGATAAIAILAVCINRATNPTDDDTIDELQWKGSIAGTVLSDNGLPVMGVSVTVDSVGFSSNTDSLGRYRIPNVSAGTYRIIFHHPHYFDTILSKKVTLVQDQDVINVNMVLRRNPVFFPGTISGIVRDSAGKGLSGISVTVDSAGYTTTTDTAGNYTIPNVLPGIHRLTFTRTGYADTVISGISVDMSQQRTDIVMVMRMLDDAFPGTVSGHVYATDSTVIKNAIITVLSAGSTTTSDSTGAYTVKNVPAGAFTIKFSHPSYFDTTIPNVTVDHSQNVTGIDAFLRKNPNSFKGSISGTVTDTAGKALSGVAVTVDSAGYTTNTDTAGFYVIPDVAAGIHRLTFTKAEYFDSVLTGIAVAMGQAVSGVNMQLRQNPLAFKGSISGTVTDTADKPISGVSVTVDSAGYSTTTDTAGHYTIPDVVAGTHRLTLTRTGYLDTVLTGITVAMSQAVTGINCKLRMDPNFFPGSISGHVYATDLSVISSAAITVLVAGNTTTSDSAGAYTLANVPVGTYTVKFSHASYFDTVVTNVTVNHSQNVTGVDAFLRKNPNFFKGSVRGLVVDSATHAPLGDAVVVSAPGGYSGTSDSLGNYIITNIPFGTYNFATSVNHRSNTRTGVVVKENDTTDVDTLYAVRLDVLPKEVGGTLTGNTSIINRIVVTIKGDLIDSLNPVLQQLTWLPISKQYNGRIYVPTAGVQWTAEVRVYDSANRVIGYQKMAFDKGAATIAMPAFNCENAKPVAIARPDTVLSINDTLLLRGAAIDSFDATGERQTPLSPVITKWEWAVGKTAAFMPTGKDTAIVLPSVQDTAYRCVLRVTDDDGNTATDTITVRVMRDAPAANAGKDTAVSINDVVRLHGSAIQTFGRIVTWEWACGPLGTFAVTSPDTTIVAPSVANSAYRCILRVTDDDNNVSTDTMIVNVLQDAPVPNAGADTTVSINDTIRLHGNATDAYGKVVAWEWDAGGTGTFRPSRKDTVIIAPKTANNTWRCVLRVTDDDGNTARDTVVVHVLQDSPVPNAGNDTAVTMGGTVNLHGTATQQFGTITKWEWAIDTGSFKQTGTGDTSIVVPQFYISGYPCRLRVTDDDGNVTIDTVILTVGYQWVAAGTAGFSTYAIWNVHLKSYQTSGCQAIYAVYADYGSYPRVAKWSGSAWNDVGSSYLSGVNYAPEMGLTFTTGWGGGGGVPIQEYEIPHLGYIYIDSAYVRKGGSWTRVAQAIKVPSSPLDLTLASQPPNSGVYIGWIDANTKLVVYGGGSDYTNWTRTGDTVSKGENAFHIEMDVGNSGSMPYVAYTTGWTAANHTVHIKRYTGGVWSSIGTWTIGDNGLSGVVNDYDQVPIVLNRDTAFVAFQDVANGNRATVRKYTGSAWVTVGTPGFSEFAVNDLSLAVGNNKIFIAYLEQGTPPSRVGVRMFDGSSWIVVENTASSLKKYDDISIAVHQGVPYLAFRDGSSGNKLTIVRLQ